jgi:hypothetical protein
LLVGIILCAVCSLFPPRRIILPQDYGHNTLHGQVTHAFVFSGEFGVYRVGNLGYLTEVDSGQLLVELVMIASLTGIIVLIPRFKL